MVNDGFNQDVEDLPFTGERYLPEVSGQIAFEHLHRYYLASSLMKGRRILDVACGEGYGSHLLSQSGVEVVGVDISAEAVAHASRRYGSATLRFVEASAAVLPFESGSFDTVVSFETIEHHDQHEEMLAEIKRVLKSDGILVISSPNKQHYSVDRDYQNPYHVKELFREDFQALVGKYFDEQALFGQRVTYSSLIVEDQGSAPFESTLLEGGRCVTAGGLYKPHYDIIVASNGELPPPRHSLFEMNVHGMDPAGFYGIHLPQRVANADARILELQKELAVSPLPAAETRELIWGATQEQRELLDALNAQIDALLNSSSQRQKHLDQLGELHQEARRLQADLIEALKEVASLERKQAFLGQEKVALEQEKVTLEQEKVTLEQERVTLKAALEREQATAEQRMVLVEQERAIAVLDKAAKDQQIVVLTQSLGSSEARLEQQMEQIRDLDDQLQTTKGELSKSKSYIDAVHHSRSWRITAWMRRLNAFFRELLN
jgi:SAM-dependent methyltransferase